VGPRLRPSISAGSSLEALLVEGPNWSPHRGRARVRLRPRFPRARARARPRHCAGKVRGAGRDRSPPLPNSPSRSGGLVGGRRKRGPRGRGPRGSPCRGPALVSPLGAKGFKGARVHLCPASSSRRLNRTVKASSSYPCADVL
jgi:hypothetical protein